MIVASPFIGFKKTPDREYFAIDLPSSSTTKVLLNGTNAHLAHERDTPREDNDAFAVGALLHAMVLDPESVATGFIRAPKCDRRTTAGKAEWEELLSRATRNQSRLVSVDLWTQALGMADAIEAHPMAQRLLEMLPMRETAVFGEIAGRAAKGKIDAASIDCEIILDVKTSQSASPREFARSAATFGYAHQAAFYRRLTGSVGCANRDFVFLVVEKAPPYLVACYRLDDAAIEAADKRLDGLIERWIAVQAGDRSGYPDLVRNINLPAWATKLEDTQDADC